MDKPPVTKQLKSDIDTGSCALGALTSIYVIVNLLTCGFGAVLIYQNWEQIWKDPVLGFLAVIFLYLFTRDMSLR